MQDGKQKANVIIHIVKNVKDLLNRQINLKKNDMY